MRRIFVERGDTCNPLPRGAISKSLSTQLCPKRHRAEHPLLQLFPSYLDNQRNIESKNDTSMDPRDMTAGAHGHTLRDMTRQSHHTAMLRYGVAKAGTALPVWFTSTRRLQLPPQVNYAPQSRSLRPAWKTALRKSLSKPTWTKYCQNTSWTGASPGPPLRSRKRRGLLVSVARVAKVRERCRLPTACTEYSLSLPANSTRGNISSVLRRR